MGVRITMKIYILLNVFKITPKLNQISIIRVSKGAQDLDPLRNISVLPYNVWRLYSKLFITIKSDLMCYFITQVIILSGENEIIF